MKSNRKRKTSICDFRTGWTARSGARALVLLALSAAVITVFSVYTTPISPYYGNDSAFFLLMGKGVTQGKIPYLDLYDQKGPMIFYVNALGYLLTGDRYGIFLMQIVNLTAACLIVYRLARFWLRSALRSPWSLRIFSSMSAPCRTGT